jgi:hypothetical protein
MYEGIITRLGDIRAIQGADYLVAATCFVGNIAIADVVVGINSKNDDLGVYFGADIQLDLGFCEEHNLLKTYDGQGNKIAGSGYLDPDKRRITSQRFKKVKSEGLWLSLATTGLSGKEGDKIGEPIARRYPKPVAKTNTSQPALVRDDLNQYFPKVGDTAQPLYSLNDFEHVAIGTPIVITEKQHGTSHRVGLVEIPTTLKWYQSLVNKVSNFLGFRKPYAEREWRLLHGTRSVALDTDKIGYYGSNQFRYDAVGTPALEKGEVVYGEIVGWVGDTPIMPAHDTKDFKELKQFGASMYYDYGQAKGTCKFYVYDIKRWSGFAFKSLPWKQIKERSKELGYDTVPELACYMWDGNVQELVANVKKLAEENGNMWSKSRLGNHISEGVVIRIGDKRYKYKGYTFKVLEGIETLPNIEDEL